MNKKVEIENEYVTLWYYPDAKIVHHKFHKFIYGEQFREALNKGFDIFIQNKATKWLSDDRNNNALPSDDVKFATEDWAPRVIKAGWKYWGLIMQDGSTFL